MVICVYFHQFDKFYVNIFSYHQLTALVHEKRQTNKENDGLKLRNRQNEKEK